MKILVFSDTHGYTTKMHEIISRKRADTDLVIHLGDHYRDVEEVSRDFPAIAFLGVRGNCDFLVNDNYPQSRTFAYDGHKFFLTHGHMQAVKHDSYALLTLAANKNGCDVALFGHTHVNTHQEVNGVTVFNPGSISSPRDFTGGTYGIITIENGKIKFEIKDSGKE